VIGCIAANFDSLNGANTKSVSPNAIIMGKALDKGLIREEKGNKLLQLIKKEDPKIVFHSDYITGNIQYSKRTSLGLSLSN